MKRFLFLIVVHLVVHPLIAQTKKDPSAYAGSINVKDVKKYLTIIASDELQGRETGSAGAKRAADYIASEFKRAGLKAPVNQSWFLKVPMIKSELTVTNFTVNGEAFKHNKSFFVNDTYPDKAIDARQVIFIGYGTTEEVNNIDLKDKVLLWINEDKPMAGSQTNTSGQFSDARKLVLDKLQSKKPALILAVNADVPWVLVNYAKIVTGPRLAVGTDPAGKVPIFLADTVVGRALSKINGNSYNSLKQSASRPGFKAYSINAHTVTSYHSEKAPVNAANVLGLVPGTDLKNELVVISAHYDHIGLNNTGTDKINNGADDDGSGIAAVLGIANAFADAKKHGNGPRRSILFLATVAEEADLLGSEYYCNHPVIPLTNTIADLNIDMIGRIGFDYIGKPDSANYIYAIGSDRLSKQLRSINEKMNSVYTQLKIDYKYDSPDDSEGFFYRSDHYSFAKKGIPVIFYFNGVHSDYHKPSDEVNKIKFDLLVKRARLVYYTAWQLANQKQRLKIDVREVSTGGKPQ